MKNLIIGIAVAGLAGYVYLTKAFSISNVKLRNLKVGFDNISFDLEMDFNNDSFFSVPLNRFVGDVELMGKSLAKIDYNTPLILTEDEATPLLINVRADTADVLNNIANISSGLFLVGTAYVDLPGSINAPIPINQSILRVG